MVSNWNSQQWNRFERKKWCLVIWYFYVGNFSFGICDALWKNHKSSRFDWISEGWKLDIPQFCPKNLYDLMINCWNENPFSREVLEIVGEWVMKRRPFWIKIFHISPILLGRFSDKKVWKLLSVLCSLWEIFGRENLQCVFSLQTLQVQCFYSPSN